MSMHEQGGGTNATMGLAAAADTTKCSVVLNTASHEGVMALRGMRYSFRIVCPVTMAMGAVVAAARGSDASAASLRQPRLCVVLSVTAPSASSSSSLSEVLCPIQTLLLSVILSSEGCWTRSGLVFFGQENFPRQKKIWTPSGYFIGFRFRKGNNNNSIHCFLSGFLVFDHNIVSQCLTLTLTLILTLTLTLTLA